jgi:hypothetical protein
MKNHRNGCKELKAMLRIAQENGCRVLESGHSIKIFPPNKSIEPYMAHNTQVATMRIAQYLKNRCGFKI